MDYMSSVSRLVKATKRSGLSRWVIIKWHSVLPTIIWITTKARLPAGRQEDTKEHEGFFWEGFEKCNAIKNPFRVLLVPSCLPGLRKWIAGLPAGRQARLHRYFRYEKA